MKLLHLDSSILGDNSASRQLTREIVDTLRVADPTLDIRYRDLTSAPIGHFSGGTLVANGTPAELRTVAQHEEAALSVEVLDEFLASDVLVIGAPMYNFSVPSQLKAWIDRVVVAGKTFRYGSNGPEGLARGKRAFVVSTAGGLHSGAPTNAGHEDYLLNVLRFVGIDDVTVVRAQGLAMGDELRSKGFAGARATIAEAAMVAE